MNSEAYIKVLENTVVPSGRALTGCNEFIFQQDGAPCHKSKLTMSWFEDGDINVLPWAPKALTSI